MEERRGSGFEGKSNNPTLTRWGMKQNMINMLMESWQPSDSDTFIKNAIQNKDIKHPPKIIGSNTTQVFYPVL